MNRISGRQHRRWKHPVFSLVFQAPDSKDSGRNRHTYKLVLGERLRNSRLKLGRPDRRGGGGGLTHGRPKPPSCLITLVGGNAVYLRPKRLSSVTGHRSSPGLPYSYRPASMSSVIDHHRPLVRRSSPGKYMCRGHHGRLPPLLATVATDLVV